MKMIEEVKKSAKRQIILNNHIFEFQKKKIKQELEKIDNKIYKIYKSISEEIPMISKMEESILQEEKNINDRFEMFLSDCDADISNIDKNIQFIKNKLIVKNTGIVI